MNFGLYKTQRKRRESIIKGEAIRECGLDFFPITMEHYEDFIQCKEALVVRQSTLPVKYVSMDYLSAIFAMEVDAMREGNGSGGGGMFAKLMHLLGLSLRIDMNNEMLNDNIYYLNTGDRIVIERMVFTQTDADGEERTAELTPFQFSTQVRPLIALQNRIELPDETENVDLVSAYESKKNLESGGVPVNPDIEDLKSTVAYLSGITDKELLSWTIRDFENRRRTIDRVEKHRSYRQAELGGMVSFKNGNPYPSLFFDPVDDSFGTTSMIDFGKKLGDMGASNGNPTT